MEEFLKFAGLNHLESVFKENDITFEIIQYLIEEKDRGLEQLIPSMGQRITFIKKFKDFLNLNPLRNNETNSEETDGIEQQPANVLEEQELHYNCGNIDIQNTNNSEATTVTVIADNDTLSSGTPTSTSSNVFIINDIPYIPEIVSPKRPRLERLPLLEEFDLKMLLMKTVVGQGVIAHYTQYNILNSKSQGYLTNIIISHFFDRDINVKLTNNIFNEIADAIVALFPRECKEVYYTAPVRKRHSKSNKAGISRGKLVDKYRNMLQYLRKCNLIAKGNTTFSDEDDNDSTDSSTANENLNSCKLWLQNNVEPWNEVIKKWEQSFALRKRYSSGNDITDLSTIFDEWPILKISKGYLLIEKDFEILYPDKANALFEKWPQYLKNISALTEKKLQSTDQILLDLLMSGNLRKDAEDTIKILLLFAICPNKTGKIIKKGPSGKRLWKPTIAESQESFILHVKIPGDLENAIQERTQKLAELKLTDQPYLIVVGPTLSDIQTVHVRINEVLYCVPSVLKALDICFKAFICLDIKYPIESEHIWYLFQWGIYDIHLKSDNKLPQVFDLLNKLKNAEM